MAKLQVLVGQTEVGSLPLHMSRLSRGRRHTSAQKALIYSPQSSLQD